MGAVWQDLRYALRGIAKAAANKSSPTFAPNATL